MDQLKEKISSLEANLRMILSDLGPAVKSEPAVGSGQTLKSTLYFQDLSTALHHAQPTVPNANETDTRQANPRQQTPESGMCYGKCERNGKPGHCEPETAAVCLVHWASSRRREEKINTKNSLVCLNCAEHYKRTGASDGFKRL